MTLWLRLTAHVYCVEHHTSPVPHLCFSLPHPRFQAMLSEARHPLLGTLMQCMAAMLKDYKAELEDILVENKQVNLCCVYTDCQPAVHMHAYHGPGAVGAISSR